jgi:hypothetical protein
LKMPCPKLLKIYSEPNRIKEKKYIQCVPQLPSANETLKSMSALEMLMCKLIHSISF